MPEDENIPVYFLVSCGWVSQLSSKNRKSATRAFSEGTGIMGVGPVNEGVGAGVGLGVAVATGVAVGVAVAAGAGA